MTEPEALIDEREALIHLRTLIKAASEIDDVEAIHKLLKEMRVLVDNTLPSRRK